MPNKRKRGHEPKTSGPNKRAPRQSSRLSRATVPIEVLSCRDQEKSKNSVSKTPDVARDDGVISSSAISLSRHKPKCFRIGNVPKAWTKATLLSQLQKIDSFFQQWGHSDDQLSLFPSCHNRSTQTALLNIPGCPESVEQRLKPSETSYIPTLDGIDLVIDSHFYGLTPLSGSQNVVADVVAVTGLAGHAFGSWRSRETYRMWLKDFLPHDVKNIRIMSYGYNSSLVGETKTDNRLLDHKRHFIEQLENARPSTEKNRPIIFMGHSLGGILILQALVEARRDRSRKSILDSTHAIMFFGTPHQGMRTEELETMIEADSEGKRSHTARHQLLTQLREGSEFLESQKDELSHIWEGFTPRIVSFYETVKTPTVKQVFECRWLCERR
ncbi:hypothetical protein K440DRAFT_38565 [Wilcoxina mikolae CBS 423.85]|nr:hypothetical protein K440DRAFT_38565 [Wilcoxina mikolae CBS 423.85]